jgi:hypothetical protein
MNQNEKIQEELLTISEVVANIPKCNVFEVPEGYFDQYWQKKLSTTLLILFRNNLHK